MVDNTAATLRIGCGSDALYRFANSNELLIARQFLDAPPVDGFEHDEVADEIEQIGRCEKPSKQDVLPRWGSTQLCRERIERERLGIFPLGPLASGGQRRAVLCHVARQRDGNLGRLKQTRSAEPGKFITAFIAPELADCLAHRVGQ